MSTTAVRLCLVIATLVVIVSEVVSAVVGAPFAVFSYFIGASVALLFASSLEYSRNKEINGGVNVIREQ